MDGGRIMSEIKPIPAEVKEAFRDLAGGDESMSLISCVYRGEPNWVIARVEEREDGSHSVTPLFMTMTPEMFDQTENPAAALKGKLAEINGYEKYADIEAITDADAKQMLDGIEQMFRIQ
jgi:hypothetical protein